MQTDPSVVESLLKEQEHLNKMLVEIFDNFNLLLDTLKTKVNNQDIVVENQSRIISNQDIIVNNQLNIINNQKQIVQNQATLAVILKTQVKVLTALEKLQGNNTSEADIQDQISLLIEESRTEFDNGQPSFQNI